MHELGMCQGVVDAVEQRAGGRRVAAVGVRAGSELRVTHDHFGAAFEMVAVGGVAADAEVDLEIVPVTATCRDCDTTFETTDHLAACPECDGMALDREGGHDLTLVWLRYADEVEADTDTGDTHDTMAAAAARKEG